MNPRAYQIVRDKRAWEGPREPAEAAYEEAIGARGWYTRGYLPHFDKPGTVQMFTFRLADSMPAALRQEWEHLLNIEDERERRTRLEAYLDRGRGACVLRGPRAAEAVERALLHSHGRRYRLCAWVVMPNHVHVLVELWDLPMGELLKVWKGASSHTVNRLLGRHGKLWQREYWDRYMRDEEHFRKTRHYIEWNPVKASLVRAPDEWAFSSANPRWHSRTDRSADILVGENAAQSPNAPPPPHAPADMNVRAPGAAAPGPSASFMERQFRSADISVGEYVAEHPHAQPPPHAPADMNVGAPSAATCAEAVPLVTRALRSADILVGENLPHPNPPPPPHAPADTNVGAPEGCL